jgi:SAM-dependent methyltransferase
MTDTSAAEAYEKYLVPNVFEPWAQLVMGERQPAPGQRVLDVGCGTGIAARLAAAAVGPGGRVVGVDIDEGMLAVARRAAGDAPIDWRKADAAHLPFADASFDVVACFECLQFFPDRTAALAELRRVLAAGGRVIGTIWGPLAENPGYRALADGLGRFVGPEAARLPPFQLDDREEIRDLLAGVGFSQIEVEPRTLVRRVPSAVAFIHWVASGAPTTRHKLSLLSDGDREGFQDFVAQRLAGYARGGNLDIPYMRHVFAAAAG